MDEAHRSHPHRNELAAFVHGTLNADEQLRIEEHVAQCDVCCDVLRQVPHDELIERLRAVNSATDTGATQPMPPPGSDPTPETLLSEIPQELADHPRYRIIKLLGAGGMGVVYQAEHRLMERTVALKVINRRLVSDEVAIERFRIEVKAAAKLSHRNIVTAYDAEQAGDLHFLVMEYIEGSSLSNLVGRHGSLSILHACNFVLQAAQGLQHAFEKGMVHRDIKPHNLMRTPKGTIKILDFGLARFARRQNNQLEQSTLTDHGMTLGTPDFISPEQARDSRTADIRADIYSLGCTLYYLLTGSTPFPTGTAIDKVVSHCEHEPVSLAELRKDVPAEVVAIVDRMMTKNVDDRYQTPAEVVDALKPFAKPGTPSNGMTNTMVSASDQLDTLVTQRPAMPTQVMPQIEVTHEPLANLRKTRNDQRPLMIAGGAVILLLVLLAIWPVTNDTPQDTPINRDGNANNPQPVVENAGTIPSFAPQDDPPPADQEQLPVATDGWINLIPQINPSQHAIAGVWQNRGGQLTVDATVSARLSLPYRPPAEYDFEVQFTRNTGIHSICLIFVAGGRHADLDIDAWEEHLAGIQNIDGRTLLDDATTTPRRTLVNGRRYTATVKVRRGIVQGFLDGQLLSTYRGDGSNLSLVDLWQLPERTIGIGAYDSDTTFHQIRVRPVEE